MEVSFLGGSDEVGASCLLVKIANHKIIVDCGIRMKKRDGEVLPQIKDIWNDKEISAVILTHGHLDHFGGLPVLYQTHDVPLYLTPPTLGLIRVMLLDALKIMKMEEEREGEIPLYSIAEVEKTIGSARPIPFQQPIDIFPDLRMTFYRSGHIAGAAGVLLESKEDGVLFISGDISVGEQLTIPGMQVPRRKPDFVVLESTYGGRYHKSRKEEEARLIEQIREVVSGGGRVLIPAFAVGRAQEVILILSRAIQKGALRDIPIFVDGLVREVCKVYRSFEEVLTPWLKKQIQKKGDPFFYEGGPIAVFDPAKREEYAKTSPAVIVSSSGMLMGGPSQFYARHLAEDEKSLIAITGYQDEEAPGRRLQNLAEKGSGTLLLDGVEVDVKCQVKTYSLSAHADTQEMADAISKLKAEKVALVHGDASARDAMDQILSAQGVEVFQPILGETIEVAKGKKTKLRNLKTTSKSVPQMAAENLTAIAIKLLERDGAHQAYTVQEIMIFFGYPADQITQEEIERVQQLFNEAVSPFVKDKKRKIQYRVRVDQEGHVIYGKKYNQEAKKLGRWSQQELLAKVNETFPPETGLYKRSFRDRANTLVLSFHFSKVALREYSETIKQIEQASKWRIVVANRVHVQALMDEVTKGIPNDWQVTKTPSIFLDQEHVTAEVYSPQGKVSYKSLAKKFEAKTGFTIDFEFAAQAVRKPFQSKESSLTTKTEKGEKFELNKAYNTIKSTFNDSPHQPIKVGLKNGYIEVGFITHKIGTRYQNRIEELEQKTGWQIKLRESPFQNEVIAVVRGILTNLDLNPSKGIGFITEDNLIRIKLSGVEENLLDDIQDAVKEAVGCNVQFK